MQYSKYLGHESQLSGVEEHRLVGGKGDGMRLLQVRNGLGLECTVSADRCADLSRVTFMGRNLSYISPCGYVAPSYYDDVEAGWLKSFTAGFLTTCGLVAVGSPCEDQGEKLPLHGSLSNTPAEHIWWHREADALVVEADINDSGIFSRKLRMHRQIKFSTKENKLTLTDTVENHGDAESPVMILYHMNMGYPLLSENAEVTIPSDRVIPRNDKAAANIDTCLKMLPPTEGYEEECFFHEFDGEGKASSYNPDANVGLTISFDPKVLDHFCEWKMMGSHDYVLGLEPGNCTPEGRDVLRQKGQLHFLKPGEQTSFTFTVDFFTK